MKPAPHGIEEVAVCQAKMQQAGIDARPVDRVGHDPEAMLQSASREGDPELACVFVIDDVLSRVGVEGSLLRLLEGGYGQSGWQEPFSKPAPNTSST